MSQTQNVLSILLLICALAPDPVLATPFLVESSADGVVVQGEELPLSQWLQTIENQSGIHFSFPESIHNQILSASIQKPSWEGAVRALLEGYNIIEVWETESRISRVIVIGRKADFDGSGPSVHSDATGVASLRARKDPELAKKIGALEKVSMFPTGHNIPSEIFDSPDIRNFLASQDIYSPEDWKNDPLKARVAKRKALQRVRELMYAHQQKKLKE